ncbi:hypothetical protein ACXJJ3_42180 (plasmid) [Kribbella sp. WER1]
MPNEEPAVLHIFSDDQDGAFLTGWGSPDRRVPQLARWIEQCRSEKVIPTAANYTEFAAAEPDGDHFHHPYELEDSDPNNAAYRYVVRTGAYGDGWTGDLTIWKASPRPDREPMLTVFHQARFTNADIRPLHQLAYHGLRDVIRTVVSMKMPEQTAPALRDWSARANWHLTKASAA